MSAEVGEVSALGVTRTAKEREKKYSETSKVRIGYGWDERGVWREAQ